MAGPAFPTGGLTLLHKQSETTTTSSNRPPQVLELNLPPNLTSDILKAIQNSEQVRLKLGKRPAISFGKGNIVLHRKPSDDFRSEAFMGPADGSKAMFFSGAFNHSFEVQQAQEAIAGADTALANLKSTLKSMQEHKASNETGFIDRKSSLKESRPTPLNRDRLLPGSTPTSPFLSAGYSPRYGPTSAPLVNSAPNKDKIRLNAMRIPIVHLLAVAPTSTTELAAKLRASEEDCERVLDKVAIDGKGAKAGKKELKEKSYRELDPWKFPYQSQPDRQTAIDHAVQAFDRLRIDKADPQWQMLLAKEDRGKGINLSRLNFDKPVAAAGNSTPKLPDRSTDGSTEGKSVVSENDAQAKRPNKATNTRPVQTKKPDSEATARVPSKASTTKAGTKAASGKPVDKANRGATVKTEGKFKSSERIEDSDEEAKAANAVIVPSSRKTADSTARKTVAKSKPVTAGPAKVLPHKSKLSNSAEDASDSGSKPRPSTPKANETAVPTATKRIPDSKQQPRPRPESSARAAKASSRPRKESPSLKPSPVRSSPPTNSTDAESSSSKATSQSSAPSSPPSSKVQNDARGSALKRKAESNEHQPPSKKHQTNGTRPADSLPNGLTNQSRRPQLERSLSTSDSQSSHGHTELTKEQVIDDARQFQRYYVRYKELHDRLARVSARDREDCDLDSLWKMHKRLEEMKANIWGDWAKLEGIGGKG